MAPASTIFARLPLFFASLLGPIVNEDPTCIGKGGFTSTCAFPGLYFNQTSVGMYCLNDQYHIYGYNWTWYGHHHPVLTLLGWVLTADME